MGRYLIVLYSTPKMLRIVVYGLIDFAQKSRRATICKFIHAYLAADANNAETSTLNVNGKRSIPCFVISIPSPPGVPLAPAGQLGKVFA